MESPFRNENETGPWVTAGRMDKNALVEATDVVAHHTDAEHTRDAGIQFRFGAVRLNEACSHQEKRPASQQ